MSSSSIHFSSDSSPTFTSYRSELRNANVKSSLLVAALIISGVACIVICALGAVHTFSIVGNMIAKAGGSASLCLIVGSLVWVVLDHYKKHKRNEKKEKDITQPLEPFQFEKLPGDLSRLVLTFVSFEDLNKIRGMSKRCYEDSKTALILKAKDYGCEIDSRNLGSYIEAGRYITFLFKQVLSLASDNENEPFKKITSRLERPFSRKPESLVVALRSFNVDDIYGTYSKLGKDFSFHNLFTRYISHLINEKYIKITALTSKNDQNAPLINAATSGDEHVARLLLTIGANQNLPDARGSLPFHFAAQNGFEKIVSLFLEHGTDVNSKGAGGDTALGFAVGSGKIKKTEKEILKTVQLLLEKGADPKILTQNGSLPLHFAAQHCFTEVVPLLLENCAVNSRGINNNTSLCFAIMPCKFKKTEDDVLKMVELLLEREADPNLVNNEGTSPLHLAAQQGFSKVVKLLMDRNADVNARRVDGSTPLSYAVGNGALLEDEDKILETVCLLLANGANPHLQDIHGSSAIHFAAQIGFSQVVGLLISQGVDVDVLGSGDTTPLCFAVRGGGLIERTEDKVLETVNLLFDNRADPNIGNRLGNFPIHFAAQCGLDRVATLLIRNGAHVNVLNSDACTPLCIAVAARQRRLEKSESAILKTVNLFLENGAEPFFEGQNDKTPLHYALDANFQRIAMVLSQYLS